MSIIFAYLEGDISKRVHITDYDEKIHKGKVTCCDGHEVIAKRGQKVVWHYSHTTKSGDNCSRIMGPWHRWWQDRVEDDFLEIILKRDGKKHIADMINGDDLVIEFQKSVVGPEIIEERERFYKNMIWIFCCVDMRMKIIDTYGQYQHLKMVGGSKFFLKANKRTFLDFDQRGVLELLEVKNGHKSKPELFVKIWTMKEIDNMFMNGCLKDGADNRIYRMPYKFERKDENFEDIKKIFSARKKFKTKKT
tara:strand:- start:10222 stop:10968 length:747 start_codon:yes stop_codon:yes gene_type:complete